MVSNYELYKKDSDKLQLLHYTYANLYWDMSVNENEFMVPLISKALTKLQGESIDIVLNPSYQETILALLNESLEPLTRREIEVAHEDLQKTIKIPKDLQISMTDAVMQSHNAWLKAKETSDFESYIPYLEVVVEKTREKIKYLETDLKGYDVLLDHYEKGLTTQIVDVFFDTLKAGLIPLIKKVTSKPKKTYPFLQASYPIHLQKELATFLTTYIGVDMTRARIGEAEHPFCLGAHKNDVRMTTHYYENSVISSIFSVLHEGGHAIYEQNLSDDIADTILAAGTSMGIHESQSRLYENTIGRSLAFWTPIYSKMVELFPNQLEGVEVALFVEAINQAETSLIRIEADELTYSLHIIIRYEIERMLFDGDLKVADLPKVWNEKIAAYLGLSVPSDAKGVLQDTHWPSGLFGYFPSYAIGGSNAAQIMHVMCKEIDVEACLLSGDLLTIREWLSEHIYQYGRAKTPLQIINDVCGESINASYYIDYLTTKYDK